MRNSTDGGLRFTSSSTSDFELGSEKNAGIIRWRDSPRENAQGSKEGKRPPRRVFQELIPIVLHNKLEGEVRGVNVA